MYTLHTPLFQVFNQVAEKSPEKCLDQSRVYKGCIISQLICNDLRDDSKFAKIRESAEKFNACVPPGVPPYIRPVLAWRGPFLSRVDGCFVYFWWINMDIVRAAFRRARILDCASVLHHFRVMSTPFSCPCYLHVRRRNIECSWLGGSRQLLLYF